MDVKKRPTMKKILIVLFPVFLLTSPSVVADAKSALCSEFLEFESKINKTLPRKIDDITELIQLSVNCETTIMKYSKAILVDESLFAEGWKSRKQRQHTQLHCNAAGLTSKEGWTAVDVWFDRDFGYLTTLTTSPTDCN